MADGTTKPIEEIQMGDVVWSYRIRNNRAEKIECGTVIKPYAHRANHLYTVTTKAYPKRELRLTGEHPVFTERGWVEAKDLRVDDKILRVWHSHTAERAAKVYTESFGKKVSQTRKARLASGEIRQPTISIEGRHKLSEKMIADNPMRRPEVVRKVQATREQRGLNKPWGNTEEQREAARQRMLTDNPMFDPERVRAVLAKGNRTRAERGRISQGQLKLAEIVEGLGFDAELEYNVGSRFIDVAIPSLNKGIEYDAWWGHFTEEGRRRDAERDEELRGHGWDLLHIGPNEPYYPEVIGRVQDFLGAHSNSRQFIRVGKIEREECDIQVYNFAVSPNENYVADGFLVHNCYETEIFRENGNRPAPYDIDAIIETMRHYPPGPATLHGGEITLMPVPDIRRLCTAAREQGRSITIQTNASIITDALIDLLAEFKVYVGVSLNGPAELNRDRRIGNVETTDKMTARIHHSIEMMRERGLDVGMIAVLSKTNAGTDELLDRLIAWAADFGDRLGIWRWRFNPLHDRSALDIELTPEEAAHAYERLADATFEDKRRIWNPFREFVDNLWGLGIQPCWMTPCDVYSTAAVHAVFGDGSEGNCLRTAQDGIPYLRSGPPLDLRQQILAQIRVEDGGCKGCRYIRLCAGGCPGEAFDDDWRNKSRFCQMYFDTYAHLERTLQGILPNFTPVPDWRTNDESALMRSINNRQPLISPVNPMNVGWSQRPSTYEESARYQRKSES